MKVVDPCIGFITNLEVLQLLQQNKERNKEKWIGNKKDLHSAIAVENQAISYLEKSRVGGKTTETSKQILTTLNGYGLSLSKMEKLQILNTLPTSEVELYLILDPISLGEVEERELFTQIITDIQGTIAETAAELKIEETE